MNEKTERPGGGWTLRMTCYALAAVLWILLSLWPHAPGHVVRKTTVERFCGIPTFQFGGSEKIDTAYGWPIYYGYSQYDARSFHLLNISADENNTHMVLAWLFWGVIVWGSLAAMLHWSTQIERRKAKRLNEMQASKTDEKV